VIDANRYALKCHFDPKPDFINRLYGCFNKEHKEHIECGEKTSDKVGRLLDIIRRRSITDFRKLIDVLKDDEPYMAQVLEKGGGKIILPAF